MANKVALAEVGIQEEPAERPQTSEGLGAGDQLDAAGLNPASEVADEGLRKAAIFLVTLEEEVAAEVFKRLSDKEAKILSQEIIRLGFVDNAHVEKVLEEFQELCRISSVIREGGADHAFNLLRKSFPPETANRIIKLLAEEQQPHPFEFLKNADVESLFPYLQEEHPQTVALVLSYMEPQQSAAILGRLSPERQGDIVRRIAMIEHTSPEAIKQVEIGLKKYLRSATFEDFQEVGGVKTCAEILNVLDRNVEKTILENLEAEDTELTDKIKKLMFVFDDITNVDERGIQAVLKEVDNKQLALALKSATPELRDKILANMSQRAAAAVKEEIEFLGPVRVADVQEAQQSIVEIVRRLEESGEIIIAGRGGEGELIE